MGREGPKWGREVFFPTNKNLADILGRTDFDFENFSPNRACGVGVLTGLLKGLERLPAPRAVHFDQEKSVLGDTCCRLA